MKWFRSVSTRAEIACVLVLFFFLIVLYAYVHVYVYVYVCAYVHVYLFDSESQGVFAHVEYLAVRLVSRSARFQASPCGCP